MLYDPKWEVQTKADVFSLESLVAWLEKKPANEEYDWMDVHGCLMCQYLQESTGDQWPSAKTGSFGSKTIKDWGSQGYYQIAGTAPFTFGAALTRAREVQAAP